MTTYYATYAALLFAVFASNGRRDVRALLYWTVLVGLFLFSGFRWQVGCDWTGYLFNYDLWRTGPNADPWSESEPAYWALIDYLKSNGFAYPYLNVATSLVFFAGLHVIARKQANPLAYLVLAFPILIINMPMSGIRQAAAIGFVCMAFVAFSSKRPLVFAGLIGLGALFHSSALVFLLMTPLVLGRFSKRNLILAAILAAPGVYFLLQSEPAEVATARYINTGIDAAGAAFRLGLLVLTGAVYFKYLQKSWRSNFPDDYKLVSLGALMMVAFSGLIFVSTVIGDRFGYYLIPIQLIIFTRIPYLLNIRNRQPLVLAPYALLTLVFVVWTQLSWHFQKCYIPYDTFLF